MSVCHTHHSVVSAVCARAEVFVASSCRRGTRRNRSSRGRVHAVCVALQVCRDTPPECSADAEEHWRGCILILIPGDVVYRVSEYLDYYHLRSMLGVCRIETLSSSLKSLTTVTLQQLSSKMAGLVRSSRSVSKGVRAIDEIQSSSSATVAAALSWALASAGVRVGGGVLEIGVDRCSLF